MVPFFDNYAIDITAKRFREVSYSELTFLPDVVEYLHARCTCYFGKEEEERC